MSFDGTEPLLHERWRMRAVLMLDCLIEFGSG